MGEAEINLLVHKIYMIILNDSLSSHSEGQKERKELYKSFPSTV